MQSVGSSSPSTPPAFDSTNQATTAGTQQEPGSRKRSGPPLSTLPPDKRPRWLPEIAEASPSRSSSAKSLENLKLPLEKVIASDALAALARSGKEGHEIEIDGGRILARYEAENNRVRMHIVQSQEDFNFNMSDDRQTVRSLTGVPAISSARLAELVVSCLLHPDLLAALRISQDGRKASTSTRTWAIAKGEIPSSERSFDAILSEAKTFFTLFPALRGVPIPDQLTTEQIKQVHRLLKQDNAELLVSHPVVDVEGKPINLEIDLDSVIDLLFLKSYELSDDQKKTVSSIFHDYPAHREWLAEYVKVREVTADDVPAHESALVGQEGVFAEMDLKKDTFVLMNEGYLLKYHEDIANDGKLRTLAECHNYFYSSVSRDGHVLEGMGVSAKLNTATDPSGGCPSKLFRTNLHAYSINATDRDTGDPLKFLLFKTSRDIKKNEQLCYFYLVAPAKVPEPA